MAMKNSRLLKRHSIASRLGCRKIAGIQPESDELVLDFVVWLGIDVVPVTEYRGGRQIEMFKDFGKFKEACWGPTEFVTHQTLDGR
jgi:hypothetical protein